MTQGLFIVRSHARIETHAWLIQEMLLVFFFWGTSGTKH